MRVSVNCVSCPTVPSGGCNHPSTLVPFTSLLLYPCTPLLLHSSTPHVRASIHFTSLLPSFEIHSTSLQLTSINFTSFPDREHKKDYATDLTLVPLLHCYTAKLSLIAQPSHAHHTHTHITHSHHTQRNHSTLTHARFTLAYISTLSHPLTMKHFPLQT